MTVERVTRRLAPARRRPIRGAPELEGRASWEGSPREAGTFLASCLSVAVVSVKTLLGALLALALAWPLLSRAAPPEDDRRRIELVARIERSVAVIVSEGVRLRQGRDRVALAPWEAVGTGVVLSRDGLVLTAAHVVVGAERIQVKLHGAEDPARARLVFSDELSDVALVRIDGPAVSLAAARLGDSDAVRKGETVYAVGNPAGLEWSLSVGVVSGRRSLRLVFGGTVEGEVIQTDAALAPGSSGSPLFDGRGDVIAIARSVSTDAPIGFALGINVVKKILGLDPCVWLGFSGVLLDERWSGALNVPQRGGVLVQRVASGEAAERASLRGGRIPVQVSDETLLLGGDVILRVDGQPYAHWIQDAARRTAKPGEQHEYRLTVVRAGRLLEMPIVEVHRPRW